MPGNINITDRMIASRGLRRPGEQGQKNTEETNEPNDPNDPMVAVHINNMEMKNIMAKAHGMDRKEYYPFQ